MSPERCGILRMHEEQDPEEEWRTEATHAMNGSGSPMRPVLAVRVYSCM